MSVYDQLFQRWCDALAFEMQLMEREFLYGTAYGPYLFQVGR